MLVRDYGSAGESTGDICDRYQLSGREGIFQANPMCGESGLERPATSGPTGTWYGVKGRSIRRAAGLITVVKVEKQKIYDELYEVPNDLISVICPIESKDDPVWEKGARSIIMAVCLAMLEDSEYPELEMTREKFCFFNINKAISNSENEFQALKEYFMGRPKLSKSVGLSRQVLSAADTTLASYMSIAFDKLSMFNDEGLCSLTSATDIDPLQFASEPTALFLKIPDEKDTRHALAAVFVLCIYKALIKVASAREDLSLPRNVYFILDEFGHAQDPDKFDKMITVGRSRKIWFNIDWCGLRPAGQCLRQTIANIIKSNCGLKMFISFGSHRDLREFSPSCAATRRCPQAFPPQ